MQWEQQKQGSLQRRNKYQLRRAGDDAKTPGPPALPQPQPVQQLKFGNTKLVRASPELLARLRQQAVDRSAAVAAARQPFERPSVAAATRQPAQPVARSTGPAPQPLRSNTWTRPSQQQPAAIAAHSRLPAAAAPVTANRQPTTGSRAGTTVEVPTSSSNGQQRVLVYQREQRGKSLRRTAVKAASNSNLTWRKPPAAVAAAVVAAPGTVTVSPSAAAASMATRATARKSVPAGSSSSPGVGSRGLQQRKGSKWYRYVRAGGPAPLAVGPRAPTTKRSPINTSKRRMSSRLLRLAGSVYKVGLACVLGCGCVMSCKEVDLRIRLVV
jgi:hypothetical protein